MRTLPLPQRPPGLSKPTIRVLLAACGVWGRGDTSGVLGGPPGGAACFEERQGDRRG